MLMYSRRADSVLERVCFMPTSLAVMDRGREVVVASGGPEGAAGPAICSVDGGWSGAGRVFSGG